MHRGPRPFRKGARPERVAGGRDHDLAPALRRPLEGRVRPRDANARRVGGERLPLPAKEDAAFVPGPVVADPDTLAQDGLHPDPVSLDRPRGDRSGRDEVDERTVVEHEVGSADVVGGEHARAEVLDPHPGPRPLHGLDPRVPARRMGAPDLDGSRRIQGGDRLAPRLHAREQLDEPAARPGEGARRGGFGGGPCGVAAKDGKLEPRRISPGSGLAVQPLLRLRHEPRGPGDPGEGGQHLGGNEPLREEAAGERAELGRPPEAGERSGGDRPDRARVHRVDDARLPAEKGVEMDEGGPRPTRYEGGPRPDERGDGVMGKARGGGLRARVVAEEVEAAREGEGAGRVPAAREALQLLEPRDDPSSGDEGLGADEALRGRPRPRAGPPERVLEAALGEGAHALPAEHGGGERVAGREGERGRAVAASSEPGIDEGPGARRERRPAAFRADIGARGRPLVCTHSVTLLVRFDSCS